MAESFSAGRWTSHLVNALGTVTSSFQVEDTRHLVNAGRFLLGSASCAYRTDVFNTKTGLDVGERVFWSVVDDAV